MLIPIVPARVSALVFQTAVNLTGTGATNSNTNMTFVMKIPTTLITMTGSSVRMTLRSGTASRTLNNVTISNAATSGAAWESTTTPTAITRSGSNAWTLPGGLGTEVVSDPVSFTVTGASALLVGINVDNTPSADYMLNNATGVTTYYKAGVQEADDYPRGAGYSVLASRSWFFVKLEVA